MQAGLLVVTGVTKPARLTRSPGASLPCRAGVRMRPPGLHPPAPLPVRYCRRRMGADRAAAACPGLPGRARRPAGGALRRAVVGAIRYVIHNGCVWRAVPADFPPWRTVYGIYQRWNASGATIALHSALRAAARKAAGRDAEPTAAVIDSQS